MNFSIFLSFILYFQIIHCKYFGFQPQEKQNTLDTISTVCSENYIKISLRFAKNFNGMIYTKDHKKECSSIGENSDRIFLRFNANKCGAKVSKNKRSKIVYQTKVKIQYNLSMPSSGDQEMVVECVPQKLDSSIPGKNKFQRRNTEKFKINEVKSETSLEIMKGAMPLVKPLRSEVELGKKLTAILKVQRFDGLDSMLSTCNAHDGLDLESLYLTDMNGCSLNENTMPSFKPMLTKRDSEYKLYYSTFESFKFPLKSKVHVSCKIFICNGTCPQNKCLKKKFSLNNSKFQHQNKRYHFQQKDKLKEDRDKHQVIGEIEVEGHFEVLEPKLNTSMTTKLQKTDDEIAEFYHKKILCLTPSRLTLLLILLVIFWFFTIFFTYWMYNKTRRTKRNFAEFFQPYYKMSSVA